MTEIPSAGELAAMIPAHVAQLCVVKAIAAAGQDTEWSSETIEFVLTELKPCLDALKERGQVPHPYSSADDDAVENFWRNIYDSED